jgi:cobalamin biosynthesis protein CobD/CbiB
MGVIAIIVALLLEQWRPLGDRRAVAHALSGWADWLERTFNAGEARHGRIAWLIAVLLPVLAAALLFWLAAYLNWVGAFLLDVAALYLTLGFRQFSHFFTDIQAAVREGEMDRAREVLGAWRGEPASHRSREEVVRLTIEEALAASHRHVFAVLFWFMLLPGPSGAILYRLTVFVQRRWGGKGEFGRCADFMLQVMEWPAVRLTAVSFAIVGDFEDAVYCWRTQAAAWADRNLGIVIAAGAGAIGVRLGMPLNEVEGLHARPEMGIGDPADAAFLDSTVGLVWRAVVVWIVVLLMLSLARAF